jgi:hypothetical protein
MNDIFGRLIVVNDLVAYASDDGSTSLSIGRVVGYCKNGADKIRVRVFQSSTGSFMNGRTRWTKPGGDVKREAGTPYVATISCSDRVAVINCADIPKET